MRRTRLALTVAALLVSITSCTTPSPAPIKAGAKAPKPSYSSTSSAPSATPLNLPDNTTPGAPGTHTSPGNWGFVKVAAKNDETASASSAKTETIIGVRVNGLWFGEVGTLAGRTFSQPPGKSVALDRAVPYFLSYSYDIISGDPQAAPNLTLLPTAQGNLYSITSAMVGERTCPDHPGPTARGIGHEVRICVISFSDDGARPTGLTMKVNDNSDELWFFDAPETQALKP